MKESDNVTILCELDSNPSSIISLVHMADDYHGPLSTTPGKPRYSSCVTRLKLTCLAENYLGKTEMNLRVEFGCT